MQMVWLALVGTLNQSNAITMMSLLWWGASTNQNPAWPVGGYHGRFNANDLIGCSGDTWPIKCYNNDVTVLVGSINLSKSCLACRSLLREVTVGGSMQMIWLAVVGTLNQSKSCLAHRSLLWEVTVGGSMQMIWLAVVGTLNQSNAITMMSLLWWGALTNQNPAWPVGVYRWSLLWEITMGVYSGRLPLEFTMGVSEHWRCIIVYPWLPLVAPSNQRFSGW